MIIYQNHADTFFCHPPQGTPFVVLIATFKVTTSFKIPYFCELSGLEQISQFVLGSGSSICSMKPTILMADDDAAFALLVAHAMKIAGLQVELVALSNGSEAVAYLNGEGRFADRSAFPYPSLLILDLHMPGLGGVAVLEWVRARAQFQSLPIVMLSSSTDLSDGRRCHALGCQSYFVKPLGLPELVDIVRQIVRYATVSSSQEQMRSIGTQIIAGLP